MQIRANELSINEKIGQMIIVGMDGNVVSNNMKMLIQEYKVGGIILYKSNYKSYKEMISNINTLKELNKTNRIPLFISIDQEGGRVNRMPAEFKNLPAANFIAKTNDIDIVRKSGQIIGRMLKDVGVNFNFAPVLDIKRFKNKHAIGDRSFGETKEEVSKYGIEVMKELQNKEVISAIKHFPGHGISSGDSHKMLPISKHSLKDIEEIDMIPFKNAIEAGAEVVVCEHILLPKIDKFYPVSLSKKIITQILKKKLKYNGIVCTDSLSMQGIQLFFGKKMSLKFAFKAGNDLLLLKHKEKDSINSIKYLVKVINRRKFEEQINDSVQKIIDIKHKYNIDDKTIYEKDLTEINEEISSIRRKVLNVD